ncbi:RNA-binding protein RO60 [Magallana gigas]|uniref:RNA-binding protein RO60 n=1 Tax=Magallana gigas TaxID=29159 RepID=UPI0033425523
MSETDLYIEEEVCIAMSIQEGEEVSITLPLTPDQTRNNAEGYVNRTPDETRFHRFLCLGSESGTFFIDQRELKKENAKCILRLISQGNGRNVVDTIREFSLQNRACKVNPILFALALCCRCDDLATKEAAYKALSDVCRIPTHLFQFIKYCQKVNPENKGWGRAHRKGVSMWYHNYKNKIGGIPLLAYHMTKYKSRFGFTHKDVFRLCHIKTSYDALGYLVNYFCPKEGQRDRENNWQSQLELARREEGFEQSELRKVIDRLQLYDDAKNCDDEKIMSEMILRYNPDLAREHVPSRLLNSAKVWKALIRRMPTTALIRNLGKISSLGLLGSNTSTNTNSFEEGLVVDKLKSAQLRKSARIHPFTLLVALKAYSKGQCESGRLNWQVNPNISNALQEAFYLSFDYVATTGKRYLLAIDVSGSMNAHVMGTPIITARDAAAAMAMLTVRTEQNCDVVAFSGNRGHATTNNEDQASVSDENVVAAMEMVTVRAEQDSDAVDYPGNPLPQHVNVPNHRDLSTENTTLIPIPISPQDDLDEVLKKCSPSRLPPVTADCAAPLLDAIKKKKKYDVFVVYTDSEPNAGVIHLSEAIKRYRTVTGITDARLIVCQLVSNGFSLTDPDDPLTMDIVGFDSRALAAIHQFVTGNI